MGLGACHDITYACICAWRVLWSMSESIRRTSPGGKLRAKSGTEFYTYAAGRAAQHVAERDALCLWHMKQALALDGRDNTGGEDTPVA